MKEAQYRVIEHKSDKFSIELDGVVVEAVASCLLYTSPSPRDTT